MGIGSARGADRSIKAAELAVASPLLEASIDGAHGVLISIQGGSNLGIFEINDAARLIQEAVHPEANIIFGAVIDDTLGDEVRVTVIAAGFDGGEPVAKPLETKRTNFVNPEPANADATAGQPASASSASPFGLSGTAAPVAEKPAWTPAAETTPAAPADRTFDDETNPDDLDIPDFLK